jgi:hypothetical protein
VAGDGLFVLILLDNEHVAHLAAAATPQHW